jgi:hypothetical protein
VTCIIVMVRKLQLLSHTINAGIAYNNPNVCGGRGTCYAPNQCSCNAGYSTSSYCATWTGPVITVPSSLTFEATDNNGAVISYSTSVTDAEASTLPTVTCNPPSGSKLAIATSSSSTYTVTCSATDSYTAQSASGTVTLGATGTNSFQVTIKDTSSPVVTVPTSTITQEATSSNGAIVVFSTSAFDNVDQNRDIVTCTYPSGSTFPLSTTTVTCSATDNHGNTGSSVFSVIIKDSTPPSISVPATALVNNIQATGPSGALVTFSTSATDIVDGSVSVTCTPASGSTFALGSTTVTCTAKDTHNNAATATFQVTVKDTVAPTISSPSDMTVEATSSTGAVVNYASATATDIVDVTDTVACTPPSGSRFPIAVTTSTITQVTCTSADKAGNSATKTFAITVQDKTAPTLSLPGTITKEATGPSGAVVTFIPSAADIVDGVDTVSCTPASGSTFALGTTQVTCSTTDKHGNLASGSFNVIVVDTTKPFLTLPASQTIQATSGAGAVTTFIAASATDIVDVTDVVTCSAASGSTFAVGNTNVTCTATDRSGNTGTGAFSITVIDTVPPTVITPSTTVVEATSAAGAVVSYTVSNTDIVDGVNVDLVTCTPSSGSTFALGNTTVSCSATDAHGNTGIKSFVVVVRDTTAPTIALTQDIVVEAISPDGAPAYYNTPSAYDTYDGVTKVSCSPVSGSTFGINPTTSKVTTVTCTSTDSNHNTATSTFKVTVVDTTKPIITAPSNVIAYASGASGTVVSYTPGTASDIVDGVTNTTCTPSSGSMFALGSTPVTCTATDKHGNVATAAIFAVLVSDITPPVVSVPGNTVLEATSSNGTPYIFSVSATDAVDGSIPAACSVGGISFTSGHTLPLGLTTITCSATDRSGNTKSTSFTVQVTDKTAPIISLPGNLTLEATSPQGSLAVFTTSATDIVDGVDSVSCNPASGNRFAVGSTKVTCTSSDQAGNTATASFFIFVKDTTPPSISTPTSVTQQAAGYTGATVTYIVGATDIVDTIDNVVCLPASGSLFAIGATTVRCNSTDKSGNRASDSFIVSVIDTLPPKLTVPSLITIEATSPIGSIVTFSISASDTVDGTLPVICSPASGSTFPVTNTTVTCTSTDSHGNTGSSKFIVYVSDTTPPVLKLPSQPFYVEAAGSTGAVAIYQAAATDVVDVCDPVVCDIVSGSNFAIGSTTIHCSSVDFHNNKAAGQFDVTVRDTTPPQINVPVVPTVEATSPNGALVFFTAFANDMVDGNVTVQCSPGSGAQFSLGTTLITCTAADKSSNQGQATFSVTVQDTKAPTIAVPSNIVLEATSPAGRIANFTVSASDIVDVSDSVTCTPTSGSTFALGQTVVSCASTDRTGNTATSSFSVTITDTTTPQLLLPTTTTYPATSANGALVSFTARASDIVDVTTPVTCTPASGSTFHIGTTTVVCTSSDVHGNTASGQFNIVVTVQTPPLIVVPGTQTLQATGRNGAQLNFTASDTDIVDGTSPLICVPQSGSWFAIGVTTVTCSSTNRYGLSSNKTFVVTVRDDTPPVLILPGNQIIEASSPSGGSIATAPTASDIVDGALIPSCSSDPYGYFPIGTTSVLCQVTDSHGNSASGSFTVTVRDTTAPALQLPSNLLYQASSSQGAVALYSATAVDNYDVSVAVTCSPASGSYFNWGTTTVNCSAVDSHGNKATGTFMITVQDITPPVIIVPSTIIQEASSSAGNRITYSATATDTYDGPVVATCLPPSGSTFAVGNTTVRCSASDRAGNNATSTFLVIINDTTPPVLTVPSTQVSQATSQSGASVTFGASAVDSVSGNVAVSCSPPSGTVFAVGSTVITCTAKDSSTNTAQKTFTVTIIDTIAPTLSLPTTRTVEATSSNGAVGVFVASASDIVDSNVVVKCNPDSGSIFPLGTTQVSCSATDSHENTASGTFTINVVDTSAPVITTQGNQVVEATRSTGAIVSYPASAYDLVDGVRSVSCSPASGTLFALGNTTVLCTSSDTKNNYATSTFTVIVRDTTSPSVSVPLNIVTQATGPNGATVTFTASAVDVVDGTNAVTCSSVSGSTFALGTATVTCSSTDKAGNKASSSFTVTVVDTTTPVLTMPANMIVEATSPAGAVAVFAATAVDTVDGSVSVTCSASSSSIFALGVTTVNCTATDRSRNTASDRFTVTVRDMTAPVLLLPSDSTIEATGPSGAAFLYSASATDTVDVVDAVTCNFDSESIFALGTTKVTCSTTDKAGNSAAGTFKVTVLDSTAPSITIPGTITLQAVESNGAQVAYNPTASDVVDGVVTVSCNPVSGSTFAIANTTVTCTATDARKNTATATFVVRVIDTTAPVVIVPGSQTVEASGPLGTVVNFTASSSDIVDGTKALTCTPPSGSMFHIGVTTVTCATTDAHGNTGSSSFNITIRDTTAPLLHIPVDISKEATNTWGASVMFSVSAYDLVDGVTNVACQKLDPPAQDNIVSGSAFTVGNHTVRCTSQDSAGNVATDQFTIQVKDTTAPSLTAPQSQVLEATGSNGAIATWTITASDVVDNTDTVVCTPSSGSMFSVGATSVTCTTSDKAGNTASTSFTVTVRDTTAPVVNVPATITTEATAPQGAVVNFITSATDVMQGNLEPSCSSLSGSVFRVGVTTVTCTVSDAAHNVGTTSFNVVVVDTTAPVISVPSTIVAEATYSQGAAVSYITSSSDTVDVADAVTCNPPSGSIFSIGTTTVLCCYRCCWKQRNK